eukprot:gene14423-biopygen14181
MYWDSLRGGETSHRHRIRTEIHPDAEQCLTDLGLVRGRGTPQAHSSACNKDWIRAKSSATTLHPRRGSSAAASRSHAERRAHCRGVNPCRFLADGDAPIASSIAATKKKQTGGNWPTSGETWNWLGGTANLS